MSRFQRIDCNLGLNDKAVVNIYWPSLDETLEQNRKEKQEIFEISVLVTGITGSTLGSLRCKCCFESTHTAEVCLFDFIIYY